jgi:hypothetical protein
MTALILISLGGAYVAGLDYVKRSPQRMDEFQDETKIRRTMVSLLSQAYLSPRVDDLSTYFVATGANGSGTFVDTLIFTSLSQRPEGGFLRETDTDFDLLSETFGPQGGVTEVAISSIPVGDDATGEGIFVRLQRPADGDITQGGEEFLLIPGASDPTFEFWDGLEWVREWDTRANQRRLPAAVKISYTIGENDAFESRTYRLIDSDITSEDPLTIEGGGA